MDNVPVIDVFKMTIYWNPPDHYCILHVYGCCAANHRSGYRDESLIEMYL